MMAYKYANALAHLGYAVSIKHGILFKCGSDRLLSSGLNPVRLQLKHRVAVVLSWLFPFGRSLKISWFDLDRRIQVKSYPVLTESAIHQDDIVLATSWRTAAFLSSTSLKPRQKFYLIQGLETWYDNEEFNLMVEDTWRAGLNNIVVANWLLEQAKRFNVEADLVPNFVDDSFFQIDKPMGKRHISVALLLSTQNVKRIDVALQVINQLFDTYPGLSVNAFGVERRPRGLRREVSYTRAPSRVKLGEIYSTAKVFVVTSDSEGWSLPAMEAMAAGTLVVSTRNGGVEHFGRGVASFADVGDSHGLSSRVLEILALTTEEQDKKSSETRKAVSGFSQARSVAALVTLLGLS